MFNDVKRASLPSLLLAGLVLSPGALATTLDLTSLISTSLDGVGMTGTGNAIGFSEGGISGTVTAYGLTGGFLNNKLETAEVSAWDTGLGVCNNDEGSILAGTCSAPNEHQVDTSGRIDYVVFSFDSSVVFDSVVIDPYGSNPLDRDTRHWIGDVTLPPSLVGLMDSDIAGIAGMGGPYDQNSSASTLPLTVDLGGNVGNILILRGLGDVDGWFGGDANDYFKVTSLTVSAVPVPSSAWLFMSALIGLAGVSRKRK